MKSEQVEQFPCKGMVAERAKASKHFHAYLFYRCEYLTMQRQWYDRSPYVNQSLFNPEWIYGVGLLVLVPLFTTLNPTSFR